MNNEAKDPPSEPSLDSEGRRQLLEKFGKFAAYAAPFTVLALTAKAGTASGSTGHGPVRHVLPK